MSVVLVLRDASQTGQSRIMGLIASALKEHRKVSILCLEGGAMLGWLRECAGPNNVRVLSPGELDVQMDFIGRTRAAERILQGEAGEIVYVSSLAISEFIIAAKMLGRFAVLHVHESPAEMIALLSQQQTKIEVLSLCDAVVMSAPDQRLELIRIFATIPPRFLDFGTAVDPNFIVRGTREGRLTAATATGEKFKKSKRLLVGMVARASEHKGCDIFFEAAKAVPDHDFIWVGDWEPPRAEGNTIYNEFLQSRLPNLFVSGSVDNPYRYISAFDLFFLSSRADLNPVVLAESLALGVPVLAFSRATAITDALGRSCILCHGNTNAPDAIRVLKALTKSGVASLSLKARTQEYRVQFDIKSKINGLLELFASLGA